MELPSRQPTDEFKAHTLTEALTNSDLNYAVTMDFEHCVILHVRESPRGRLIHIENTNMNVVEQEKFELLSTADPRIQQRIQELEVLPLWLSQGDR